MILIFYSTREKKNGGQCYLCWAGCKPKEGEREIKIKKY